MIYIFVCPLYSKSFELCNDPYLVYFLKQILKISIVLFSEEVHTSSFHVEKEVLEKMHTK